MIKDVIMSKMTPNGGRGARLYGGLCGTSCIGDLMPKLAKTALASLLER